MDSWCAAGLYRQVGEGEGGWGKCVLNGPPFDFFENPGLGKRIWSLVVTVFLLCCVVRVGARSEQRPRVPEGFRVPKLFCLTALAGLVMSFSVFGGPRIRNPPLVTKYSQRVTI